MLKGTIAHQQVVAQRVCVTRFFIFYVKQFLLDKNQHQSDSRLDLSASLKQQRESAAEMVEQQRSSLLTRIHILLGDDARRLTGTDDILSTAWRRIDTVIMQGNLKAQTDQQIYAFVHGVIERTILEKARSSRRLTRREQIAQQLKDHQTTGAVDANKCFTAEDVQRVGQVITNPIDREIVLLRGRDLSFAKIAEIMHMEDAAVRMRWSRIRQRVNRVLGEDSK